jgi:DNA-binding transcriptional LysR family regulator
MQFDWNDLKFFLELVRTGSPSDAGRRLKADHTTVRRRIDSLEGALRARLFASRGTTYELTVEGDRLLQYAEAMEALAIRAEDQIANSNLAVTGTVRIGAPDGFGVFYLAPRISALQSLYPDLQVQLVVLPGAIKLSKREADVAIALSRPDEQRQIVRKLTAYHIGLYASEAYLNDHPPIAVADDLSTHSFINYVPELLYAAEIDTLSQIEGSPRVSFESTSIVAQIQAAVSGAGLCMLPSFMAASEPRLKPVLQDVFKVERQFWLVIHPEMVNLARVRAVIDFIAEGVRNERSLFLGSTAESVRSLEAAKVS